MSSAKLAQENLELLPAFIQKWEQTVYQSVYGKTLNYIKYLLSMSLIHICGGQTVRISIIPINSNMSLLYVYLYMFYSFQCTINAIVFLYVPCIL